VIEIYIGCYCVSLASPFIKFYLGHIFSRVSRTNATRTRHAVLIIGGVSPVIDRKMITLRNIYCFIET